MRHPNRSGSLADTVKPPHHPHLAITRAAGPRLHHQVHVLQYLPTSTPCTSHASTSFTLQLHASASYASASERSPFNFIYALPLHIKFSAATVTAAQATPSQRVGCLSVAAQYMSLQRAELAQQVVNQRRLVCLYRAIATSSGVNYSCVNQQLRNTHCPGAALAERGPATCSSVLGICALGAAVATVIR
jgi:hypothetical protein